MLRGAGAGVPQGPGVLLQGLSTRLLEWLFTFDLDSCIIGVELEWCYTLLVSEATASPISLDSEAIGQRRPL